jgi:hypothetical protein
MSQSVGFDTLEKRKVSCALSFERGNGLEHHYIISQQQQQQQQK